MTQEHNENKKAYLIMCSNKRYHTNLVIEVCTTREEAYNRLAEYRMTEKDFDTKWNIEEKPLQGELIETPTERLRKESGTIRSNSKLVQFLYQLMRDELVPGVVEKIVQECTKTNDECIFTNGYLAEYAINLSKRLTESEKEP